MSKCIKDQLVAFIRAKRDADGTKLSSQPYRDFYNRQFMELKKKSKAYVDDKTYPTVAGENPENRNKNRYKDILPFDYTRVELDKLAGKPQSDYINANFVKDVYQKNHYIASQGPMPTTLSDFWRMIWKYKIKVIIMACNEYEGVPPKTTMEEAEKMFFDVNTPPMFKPKLRCKKYWASESSPLTIDDIHIKISHVRSHKYETGEYTVREMKAVRDGEERTVIQLHYEGWPDHGVPQSPFPLLNMICEAREYQGISRNGPPLLVHCSAGCGRTGTIIVIDYCWNLIKTGFANHTGDFNLHEILKEMRKQRPSIVQSVEQYEFVFCVVAELFGRQLDAIEGNIYANVSDEEDDYVEEEGEGIYENVGDTSQEDGENAYSIPTSLPLPQGKVPKPGRLTIQILQAQANNLLDSDMNHNHQTREPTSPKPPISPNKPITKKVENTKKESTAQTPVELQNSLKIKNGQPQQNVSTPLGQRTLINVGSKGDQIQSKSGHRTVVTIGQDSAKIRQSSVKMDSEYSEPYGTSSDKMTRKGSGSGTKPKSPTSPKGEYAYADPKSTNKWSLQGVALAGVKSKDTKSGPEPLYAEASAEYEEVDVKNTAKKTRSNDSSSGKKEEPPVPHRPPDLFPSSTMRGERHSDTLSTHSSTSVSSSNGHLDNIKGSIGKFNSKAIVDKLNAVVGKPKTADPNVKSTGQAEEVFSKGEDISYPSKMARPKGPRNPSTFQLPKEFITRL